MRWAGWPIFATPMIWRMARTNRAIPTTVMASDRMMATSCMEAPTGVHESRVRLGASLVLRCVGASAVVDVTKATCE
ncbi:hypothetical protein GCM10027596_00750 [Nocardioides korecus]